MSIMTEEDVAFSMQGCLLRFCFLQFFDATICNQ